jgi:hypothetical protein
MGKKYGNDGEKQGPLNRADKEGALLNFCLAIPRTVATPSRFTLIVDLKV